jgi:hypothetical protein
MGFRFGSKRAAFGGMEPKIVGELPRMAGGQRVAPSADLAGGFRCDGKDGGEHPRLARILELPPRPQQHDGAIRE